MRHLIADSKGSVLLIAVITLLVISAMTMAFLVIAASGSSEGIAAAQSLERLYMAEAGVSASLAEIRANADYDGDGLGDVTADFALGEYQVTAVLNADTWTITSVGTDDTGYVRAIEVLAETATIPLSADGLAAVTSMAPVSTTGSIIIDGRDHDINGNLVGPGVLGIASGGAITPSGNSKVGGNGIGPIRSATEPDGVFDENYDFSVKYPSGYPTDPDEVMELPAGTLRAAAAADGTLFTSQATYDAFIAANGGSMPGGAIVYLDFAVCIPTELGNVMNDPPSLFIMHNAAGNSNAKNLHGKFKGFIICDSITHVNAQTMILGAVQTIWPSAVGNAFGNGNSDILFSSEVLANLPGASGGGGYDVVSWREVSP